MKSKQTLRLNPAMVKDSTPDNARISGTPDDGNSSVLDSGGNVSKTDLWTACMRLMHCEVSRAKLGLAVAVHTALMAHCSRKGSTLHVALKTMSSGGFNIAWLMFWFLQQAAVFRAQMGESFLFTRLASNLTDSR